LAARREAVGGGKVVKRMLKRTEIMKWEKYAKEKP